MLSVSGEDVSNLCQHGLHIKEQAVIAFAKTRWTNYVYMAKYLLLAETVGLALEPMIEDDFSLHLRPNCTIRLQKCVVFNEKVKKIFFCTIFVLYVTCLHKICAPIPNILP